MRAVAKDAYRKHYELVRRVTPPERLLEFRLEDGWGPLCKILNKSVPDEPFPRTNEKEYLNEKITIMMRKRGIKVIGGAMVYAASISVIVIAIWWYYPKQHQSQRQVTDQCVVGSTQ